MPIKVSNITEALRKPFMKQKGLGNPDLISAAWDNNYTLEALTAAGTAVKALLSLGRDDVPQIGGAPRTAAMARLIPFNAVANAGVATRPFHVFTSTAYGRIVGIKEIHGTAGNDSGAVTAHITRERGAQAAGSGVSLMSGTFNLKGTADTEQVATLTSNIQDLKFQPGDKLSVKITGTATAVAGLYIAVYVLYDSNIFETSVYLASGNADQVFFLANRKYPIVGISAVFETAEVTTATQKVQVKIQDGTETESQGTAILTNNSNGGFDCVATAKVVQNGTFTALSMLAGERLSVDYSGTSNELANLVVTVAFTAQPGRQEVSMWWAAPAATDHYLFLSDRNYRVHDGRQIHGTAAGGTSTMQLEKVTGTNPASTGTALLGTPWDLNATADTPQVFAGITVLATLQLDDGDRLSHDFGHAIQSSTNFAATYSLLAE